jgi:hypothetical protein
MLHKKIRRNPYKQWDTKYDNVPVERLPQEALKQIQENQIRRK